MISNDQILAGLVCPYCGAKTELIDSAYIYGKSYGMIYICKPCDAYVGVHKGTDKALGRLANRELREAKKKAHYYFDQIAKTMLINQIWRKWIPDISNRNKAYKWLASQMGISENVCHIGMMDVAQCQQVIEICKRYISKDSAHNGQSLNGN
jgi:hypothetical protein